MIQSLPKLWVDLLSNRYVGPNILHVTIHSRDWSSHWFIGSIIPFIYIHEMHLTVKDMLSTNDPRSEVLYSHLPLATFEFIKNMLIKFNPSTKDVLAWTSNKSGAYSNKSSYTWLLSRTNTIPTFNPICFGLGKQNFRKSINFLFGWLTTTLSLLSYRSTIGILHHRLFALIVVLKMRLSFIIFVIVTSLELLGTMLASYAIFVTNMHVSDWLKVGYIGT